MIRALVVVALLTSTARADERSFQLHNREAKRPAPLVVALHCYGCAPGDLPVKLGLEALAKKVGFVLAVPTGRSDSQGHLFWNATAACCDFDGQTPDDVGYVMGIIDDLVKRGIADPRRVYLVGFSNGGFLAHRLACEHADRIAAIVSIGGAAPERCDPAAPVSVLEVHGQADPVVPIAGGTLTGGLPRRGTFPAARAALVPWVRVDHCRGGEPWKCPHNAVELWALPGGHWPETSADFGERIWRWLAAQHK